LREAGVGSDGVPPKPCKDRDWRQRQQDDYAFERRFPTWSESARFEHAYFLAEGAHMENDGREGLAEVTPLWLAPAMATEVRESVLGDAAWWLLGGASLLVWTLLALVLTAS